MALVNFIGDLFEGPTAGSARGELVAAYDNWARALRASNRIKRDSSLDVYESMWSAFVEWCVVQDPVVTLGTMTDLDLRRFLTHRMTENEGALSNRHAWRILTLIDRVQAHRSVYLGVLPNPAAGIVFSKSAALRQANQLEKPSLDYLSADQAARLVNYLRAVRPGAVGHRRLSGWEELRSLAAVALHIGAGLTPGDVRALGLFAPQFEDKRIRSIKVPSNGNRPERESPVARWAAGLLEHWLGERKAAGLPVEPYMDVDGVRRGPYLFPARRGVHWEKGAHFKAVQKVLTAAEIDTGLGGTGGLRLRHTFAIRQLKQGKSPADIARYMGIVNVEEMDRYLAVVFATDKVV